LRDPVEMMASTTLPFAAARQFMVDSQLRPNKVTNPALLEAMRQIPREVFLPPALASLAYGDQDVRLGHGAAGSGAAGGGRVLMAPLAFARLAQLLDLVAGERVLVVGSGTGYGAAVLASCGARVTALDEDEALLDLGRTALRGLGLSVTTQHGRHRDGLPGLQPWDAILIQGAIEFVPTSFAAQLRAGTGRLVTVLGKPDRPGVAALGERQGAELALAMMFDCTTAILPGFETVSEFEF
jgi:protein-L-isoaspartate(D-aspartate) O-methyltransferase